MTTVAVPRPAGKQRRLDAQENAFIQRLVASTPEQIDAYLTAHVTTVAEARAVLKALALGLRHLYMKEDG